MTHRDFTRRMTPASFVGRVGGLAVALGIGTAVLTGIGCGTASAETAGSSSPSSDSASNSSPSSSTSSSTSSDSASNDSSTTSTSKQDSGSKHDTHAKTDGSARNAADDEATADDTSQDDERDTDSSPGDEDAPTESDADQPALDDTSPGTPDSVPIEVEPAAHDVGDDTAAPPVDTPPAAPSAVALTVLASAQREVEDVVSGDATDLAPATHLQIDTVDAVAASTTTTSPSPATPITEAEYDEAFTGQPSLIANVVVTALRLYDFVATTFHLPSFAEIAPKIGSLLGGGGAPPPFATLGLDVQRTEYDGWEVYTLTSTSPSGEHVVALHGGAYVGQVNILQWMTYANMARETGATVVLPLFPLAPEGTAGTVVPKVAEFISAQVAEHGAENVSVLGDSSGGQIALSAVQLLVQQGATVPGRMVLISPVLDNTFSNPNIGLVDDPLVSVAHGRENAALWAGDLPLTDPLVSPIYGSLDGLPPTAVYSGSLSLLAPDALLLQQQALAQGAPVTFVNARGQIEDWIIFFFLPDARRELPGMYELLGLTSTETLVTD